MGQVHNKAALLGIHTWALKITNKLFSSPTSLNPAVSEFVHPISNSKLK